MGLSVAPPDVNASGAQFAVAGDVIRFGLAAIKNVGATAIDSIVRFREAGGAFASLTDFCVRSDPRLVNRRVIESLIKAGAFDSLRRSRAGLLAELDHAMDAGQRRQREHQEGQGSLFATLGGDAPPDADREATREVPEWPAEQLLAHEKEVLGFYLSGHPLERYRETAGRLGSLSVEELASRPVGARVTLLGHVGGLRERATKSGTRMAFATLETVDGLVSLTVFPDALRSQGPALRGAGAVVVRGRVDDTDKGRVVLVEEVVGVDDAVTGRVPGGNGAGRAARRRQGATAGDPFGEALEEPESPAGGGAGRHPHTCRLRVRVGDGDAGSLAAALAELRQTCERHPGATPLFLHVLLADQEVVLKVTGCRVDPTAELINQVERLLGRDSVLVEYAGRA